MFRMPTRRIRNGTSSSGTTQDTMPRPAKRNPHPTTTGVRGKGPMGVLPAASICTAKMIISRPSWALLEKGSQPRLTGMSRIPSSTMNTPTSSSMLWVKEKPGWSPGVVSASG